MRNPIHARAAAVPTGPGREALLVEPFPQDPGSSETSEAEPGAGTTVLLLSGLGGGWFDWIDVAACLVDRLGPAGRVLVMDRPGVGEAPAAPEGTTDLDQAVRDVYAVWRAAGGVPLTLVGHSMGAWYAEAFARRHPDAVAELVLVDGSTAPVPGPFDDVRLPAPVSRPRRLAVAAMRHTLHALARTPLGWERVGPVVRRLGEDRTRLAADPVLRERCARAYARPCVWAAVLEEWGAFLRLRDQLALLRVLEPLPAIGLTVLTATGNTPDAVSPVVYLADRHSDGLQQADPEPELRRIRVGGAPHMVMLSHPERVAAAILVPAAPH